MKILVIALCCFCFINTSCTAPASHKKVATKPSKQVYVPSAVPDGTVFVYGGEVVWTRNPQPAPITNAPAVQPAPAHSIVSAPAGYATASVYASAYVPSPVEVEFNPYTGESTAVYSRSPFMYGGGYGYGGRYGFGAYGYNGSFGGSFSGDLSYGLYSYRGSGYSYLYRGGTRSLFGVTFTPRWNYDYYTGPATIYTTKNVSVGFCADGTLGTGGGAAVYGR